MVPVGGNARRRGAYAALGVATALLATLAPASQPRPSEGAYRSQQAQSNQAPSGQGATLADVASAYARGKSDAEQQRPFYEQPDFWVATFTGVLVLANILLWIETGSNAAVARSAAKVAESALVDVEAAFVFMKVMKIELIKSVGLVRGWEITPVIENSGSTRARWTITHVSFQYQQGNDLPEDYDFPDQWNEGIPEKDRVLPRPTYLGPKATIECGPLFIHIVDVAKIIEGKMSVFVYGWIEYNDVFSEIRHRTEYCYELLARGTLKEIEDAIPILRTYSRFNGAEDECFKAPTTKAPPRVRRGNNRQQRGGYGR